jgi:hypothetical protein
VFFSVVNHGCPAQCVLHVSIGAHHVLECKWAAAEPLYGKDSETGAAHVVNNFTSGQSVLQLPSAYWWTSTAAISFPALCCINQRLLAVVVVGSLSQWLSA